MTLKSSLPLVGATIVIIVVQVMCTYLVIRKQHQVAWQVMESFKAACRVSTATEKPGN